MFAGGKRDVDRQGIEDSGGGGAAKDVFSIMQIRSVRNREEGEERGKRT